MLERFADLEGETNITIGEGFEHARHTGRGVADELAHGRHPLTEATAG